MCNPVASVKKRVKKAKEKVTDAAESAFDDTKKFFEAPRSRLKKTVGGINVEEIGRYVGSTLTGGGSNYLADVGSREAGFKTSMLTNPSGAIAAEAGESTVDQPKAEAEQMQRLAAEQRIEQQNNINRLNRRRKQEEATEKAGKRLRRGRAKQESRRSSRSRRGRAGTILTSQLGGVGGVDSENRKTILGS